MNNKIFSLIQQNLQQSFSLKKYQGISISQNSTVEQLPWTPAKYRKFKNVIEAELGVTDDFLGTVADIVNRLDQKYSNRFFGEIWRPHTDDYNYTGWTLVEEVNSHDFKNVLDVGCGYNQFKNRILNLTGIDPYNNCADYMVDILEYANPGAKHDCIIALGSINFNSRNDIESRFAKCVDLLDRNGYMYFRVNPGIAHKNGPYIEIFPWAFEVVKEFELKYNLRLLTYKKDHDRVYFVYIKN